MADDMEFQLDKDGQVLSSLKPSGAGRSVIKKSQVRLKSATRLHTAPAVTATHESKLLPITKNGEIIGFINECACGEITKVYFDFDE